MSSDFIPTQEQKEVVLSIIQSLNIKTPSPTTMLLLIGKLRKYKIPESEIKAILGFSGYTPKKIKKYMDANLVLSQIEDKYSAPS